MLGQVELIDLGWVALSLPKKFPFFYPYFLNSNTFTANLDNISIS